MLSRFSLLMTMVLTVASLTAAKAHAHSDEQLMLMQVAQQCKIGSGQTSVPSGLAMFDPLSVISKKPGELLSVQAIPPQLIQVPYEHSSPKMMAVYVRGVDFETMVPEALSALVAMIEQADADLARTYFNPADPEAHRLYVHSAYRAYDVQCRLFNKKIRREMELYPDRIHTEQEAIASVNSRSALPGQSEHQLGTAADIVYKIPGMGYELEPEMDRTPGFAWLQANAFRYGFALSYPRGPGDVRLPNARTGYVYEPWHWRYVGVAHATAFNMCAKRGMTLAEYLRQIKRDPRARCAP